MAQGSGAGCALLTLGALVVAFMVASQQNDAPVGGGGPGGGGSGGTGGGSAAGDDGPISVSGRQPIGDPEVVDPYVNERNARQRQGGNTVPGGCESVVGAGWRRVVADELRAHYGRTGDPGGRVWDSGEGACPSIADVVNRRAAAYQDFLYAQQVNQPGSAAVQTAYEQYVKFDGCVAEARQIAFDVVAELFGRR